MYKELLNNLEEYKKILESIKGDKFPVGITGVFGSQKSHMVYSLASNLPNKIIYIASNEMEALHIYKDLKFFLEDGVIYFRSRDVMLYDLVARSSDDIHDRMIALDKIATGEYKILVTSVDAIIQRVVARDKFCGSILEIKQ